MKSTAAAVLTVLVLAGCSSEQTPETFAVTGEVKIGGRVSADGEGCGSLRGGAEVRIVNGDGSLLGVGELGGPAYDGTAQAALVTPVACSFPFTIDDVPAGEKFYEVTVDDRKAGTYSEDEIREPLELA
jgi:hypothetical protein